jgi:hypothetical protein
VVHGVDLEEEGYRVFESVAREWGGEVAFERDDALAWMRRQRGHFDGIVEDLSVPQDGDVVKPEVSWSGLPPVIRRSVKRRGVVVSNLLPTPRNAVGRAHRGVPGGIRSGGRDCEFLQSSADPRGGSWFRSGGRRAHSGRVANAGE